MSWLPAFPYTRTYAQAIPRDPKVCCCTQCPLILASGNDCKPESSPKLLGMTYWYRPGS